MKAMKNFFKILLIIALIANLAGCAELQRKFTRKKEPKKQDYSFYRVEEYQSKPPHERYAEHFMLWRNWQGDLERTSGTSHLRDLNSANEALRHLTAMRDLLQDEQAQELGIEIEKMEKLTERIKYTKSDIITDVHSRRMVERIGRLIMTKFSYKNMRDHIKSDIE